jgi:hypothetical protein
MELSRANASAIRKIIKEKTGDKLNSEERLELTDDICDLIDKEVLAKAGEELKSQKENLKKEFKDKEKQFEKELGEKLKNMQPVGVINPPKLPQGISMAGNPPGVNQPIAQSLGQINLSTGSRIRKEMLPSGIIRKRTQARKLTCTDNEGKSIETPTKSMLPFLK